MMRDVKMTEPAFHILGETRPGDWLLTCDHASNRVPPFVANGNLGLNAQDMARHIAYDVGAAGVTRALADLLDAPAVLSDFSRLVIDPNRGRDDPTLLMQLYDGTVIPGNRHIDGAERERRLDLLYRPYHAAIATLAANRAEAIYVAIHSFTPRLKGRPDRPWHIGVLHDPRDSRFARALIDCLAEEPDLIVGDNEPYSGALKGDSVDTHALSHGRANALIELRHDLIEAEQDQRAWAVRLAPILETARRNAQL